MMKINRIRIDNFKPYKKIRLPLEGELPDGMFVVQGPNSSGKTSLAEAFFWALWGPRAIRWVKQEQLIRKDESSCQVSLDFEVEGAKYRVKRKYTRGSGVSAVLFKKGNGKYVPIETNVSPVEKRIDDILGISYNEALQTLFVQQGEVDRLAVATPAELRDLVRDLFGLERLEKINGILRDQAKTLDGEIRKLDKELAVLPEKKKQKKSLEKRLEKQKNRMDKLSQTIKDLEEELEKIPETQTLKDLKQLNAKIKEINQNLQTQKEQLKVRSERKNEIEKELEEATQRLKGEKEKHKKVAKKMEKLPKAGSMRKLRELGEQLTLHQKAKMEVATETRKMAEEAELPFDPVEKTEQVPHFASQLKATIKETGENLEKHRKAIDSLIKSLGSFTGRRKELHNNVETLKGEKECPTCLRPLTKEELPQVLEGIQFRISSIGTNIQKLEKEISNKKDEREGLSDHLEEIKAKTNLLSSIQKNLQKHLEEAKKEEAAVKKWKVELEKMGYPKLEDMLSTWDVDNLDELTEKRGKISSQAEAHEKEVERLEKELNGLDSQWEKVEEKVGRLEEKIQTLKKNLEGVRKSLKEALQALKVETIESLLEPLKKKNIDELIIYRTQRQTELQGKKDAEKDFKAQIKEATKKRRKTVEEIQQLHEKEESLKGKKKEHTHIEQLRILVDDFISEDVVRNRLCGSLKEATTGYLTRFSTGRYSLLDIDAPSKGPYGAGVIITLKDHIDQLEKTRELLSGGDRASLGLALRMAISRLISRIRPFKSEKLERPKVKCLIMDEPLGSLDSERRPEVVRTLIDDKAFNQIFLITHTNLLLSEEELVEAHQISIYQEGGISKISYQPATLQTA